MICFLVLNILCHLIVPRGTFSVCHSPVKLIVPRGTLFSVNLPTPKLKYTYFNSKFLLKNQGFQRVLCTLWQGAWGTASPNKFTCFTCGTHCSTWNISCLSLTRETYCSTWNTFFCHFAHAQIKIYIF